MRTRNIKLGTGNTPDRHRSGLLGMLLVLILAFAVALPGSAQTSRPGHKIAPDLVNFPVNSDGTLDVIIQFNEKPQAKHFQMMAAHGGKFKHEFEHIKGAAYRIPVAMLNFLENDPDVVYVTPDRVNQTSNTNLAIPDQAVMADVAQQQYGFDGTGVGIAIIDSGIYSHADLQNSTQTASRIVYSESFVPGDSTTNDAYGHGTHVAGIAAGNGASSQANYPSIYQGIAPNANIINLRVLDQNGVGTDSQVIAAIDTAIQLQSTYNIRVINLSLGRPVYESYTLDPLCQAVEAAWQEGIVVVVAAGNNGRDNSFGEHGYATIEAPGNDPNVITVGATDTNGTATRTDDTIASYSSKGPTLIDHIVKPDLVAPGNRITSLLSPGSTLATNFPSYIVSPSNSASGRYFVLSGTSMATPVVSGAAALMIQENPEVTPDTVKARMMKTAWKGYPVNSWASDIFGHSYFSQYDIFTVGAGYLDVDAVLGNTDVVNNAGAASPIAVFNGNRQVSLVNGTSIVWESSIVWNSSIVWTDSIIWSQTIMSNSIIWGAANTPWGDNSLAATSLVWSNSIIWDRTLTALTTGDDGDN